MLATTRPWPNEPSVPRTCEIWLRARIKSSSFSPTRNFFLLLLLGTTHWHKVTMLCFLLFNSHPRSHVFITEKVKTISDCSRGMITVQLIFTKLRVCRLCFHSLFYCNSAWQTCFDLKTVQITFQPSLKHSQLTETEGQCKQSQVFNISIRDTNHDFSQLSSIHIDVGQTNNLNLVGTQLNIIEDILLCKLVNWKKNKGTTATVSFTIVLWATKRLLTINISK